MKQRSSVGQIVNISNKKWDGFMFWVQVRCRLCNKYIITWTYNIFAYTIKLWSLMYRKTQLDLSWAKPLCRLVSRIGFPPVCERWGSESHSQTLKREMWWEKEVSSTGTVTSTICLWLLLNTCLTKTFETYYLRPLKQQLALLASYGK